MSWMSDYTGRPKEEGGHKRINISADLPTRSVLDMVENRSKFIEYCIKIFIKPKWVIYHEPKQTVNANYRRLAEGASFEFAPYFNPSNAVLRANCYFDHFCENGGMAFRVTVNGKRGLRLVEHSSGRGYSCSCVYDEKGLGFENMWKTFYNQDSYALRFEFKPLKPAGTVSVKDIHFAVQVVESPLLNEITGFSDLNDIYDIYK
jgi:hypothetical protein